MSCSPESARCPTARRYAHRLPECCREHVRTLTADVAEALDDADVTWWADYGTLLGAVRNPLTTWDDYPWLPESDDPIEPGIIPHDKDADLGAMADDYATAARALRDLAKERGYNLRVRSHRGSIKVRLSRTNHTNVDIFFWQEREDGTLYRQRYIAVDKYKGKEFHRDDLFPLGTVEWEGMTLPAPNDPEAFCEFRYGAEWMTPVSANHDGVRR